tara:strand:+ start:50 stop:724 length:675 start_codon:yes stop_codon:yes gene_type:complete
MVDVKQTDIGVKYVLYLRVSTHKQGRNGNGIESQERDISIFLSGQKGCQVIGKYVEVQSGKDSNRKELQTALNICRKTGAHLVASHVDRISRDVEFIARLVKDPKVTIRVANLPNADNFQIHLFSALACAEREFISRRTKKAMAVCKSRGKKFGNPNIAELNKTRIKTARSYTNKISPIVMGLRKEGLTYQRIADTLNEMGIKTPKGSTFYPTQVQRVIERTVV